MEHFYWCMQPCGLALPEFPQDGWIALNLTNIFLSTLRSFFCCFVFFSIQLQLPFSFEDTDITFCARCVCLRLNIRKCMRLLLLGLPGWPRRSSVISPPVCAQRFNFRAGNSSARCLQQVLGLSARGGKWELRLQIGAVWWTFFHFSLLSNDR